MIRSILKLFSLPVALGFAIAAGGASATEYVTNGGFEQSQYTNSLALFGTNTPATDWTSTGQWVMFCSGSGVSCDNPSTYGYLVPPVPLSPQGGNFMAIDGTSGFNGSIYQTISGLTAGEMLKLSFYMATAQECCGGGATTETVTATLGDQVYTTPTISTPAAQFTPWTLYSTTFTYDGMGDVLTFVNNGTGVPPYALIDGVSLTTPAVPEPSTWLMMIAGFAGIVLLARARRAQLAAA